MRQIAVALLLLTASAGLASGQPAPAAACLDLSQPQSNTFSGVLMRRTYPGAPNYESVRKGDRPEAAYILKMRRSVCVTGDAFADPAKRIDRVQVFPAETNADAPQLWKEMRKLAGRSVTVDGRGAFAAHTGHHHAPLLLPITAIRPGR
jgi:hypothetical protein